MDEFLLGIIFCNLCFHRLYYPLIDEMVVFKIFDDEDEVANQV